MDFPIDPERRREVATSDSMAVARAIRPRLVDLEVETGLFFALGDLQTAQSWAPYIAQTTYKLLAKRLATRLAKPPLLTNY